MKQDGTAPFEAKKTHPVRPSFGQSRQHDERERDRVAAQIDQRFETLAPQQERPAKKLSRVERAMRRNAPDLAGGTDEEILADRARRRAHHFAKRPRPRLVALLVLITSGVLEPILALQLGVWCVVVFLVLSVVTGPERARDYSKDLWRRFISLWKHEIVLARKGLASLRQWVLHLTRSSL